MFFISLYETTLLSLMERGQEFWLLSSWEEGLARACPLREEGISSLHSAMPKIAVCLTN